MPKKRKPFKDFDICLEFGEEGEQKVREMLANENLLEVKRDAKVGETGNIAVEVMCNDALSGVAATKAPWFVFMLDGKGYDAEVVVFVRTKRLLQLIEGRRIIRGGDGNRAEMVLLPVSELVRKI